MRRSVVQNLTYAVILGAEFNAELELQTRVVHHGANTADGQARRLCR